jgi:hypothetical protein
MATGPFLAAPTWPPAAGAYDYILTLNNEELAWEALRRNPDYQRHFRLNDIYAGKPRRLPSAVAVAHLRPLLGF